MQNDEYRDIIQKLLKPVTIGKEMIYSVYLFLSPAPGSKQCLIKLEAIINYSIMR